MYGVDLNPFAVEIARFRLLIAALNACGIERLRRTRRTSASIWRLATACFTARGSVMRGTDGMFEAAGSLRERGLRTHMRSRTSQELRILGQQYHAVVGNPPYITVEGRGVE